MAFSDLETLRRYLSELDELHVPSLSQYYDKKAGGFVHKHEDVGKKAAGDPSKASSATCVQSLTSCAKWEEGPWAQNSQGLVNTLLSQTWESAGLEVDNPFTVAWILEAVTALQESVNIVLDGDGQKRVEEAERILIESLQSTGGASVAEYPPSAYVTQLVVRILQRRSRLKPDISAKAREWAWSELRRQLALRVSESKFSDIYSLAYSALITVALSSPADARPEEKRSQQTALKIFFDSQNPGDGSWPLSRPLFHYPGVGNAYCFEYELLAQLLGQERLRPDLLNYIPNLITVTNALKTSYFPIGSAALGWASGHHPQLQGAESWSTASVFYFAHLLDRLVAEAIRRELFASLDMPYPTPREPSSEFAARFVDGDTEIEGQPQSLKKALLDRFVEPIKQRAHLVRRGRPLTDTAISAIFFGPPGTSKTTLAELIAEYLGWPLLVVDPSHLVRNGMDRVQAEANTLFSMLAAAEGLVALFDEFDEMVRERSLPDTETVSRFLTTAMLPKLSLINKRKRIVFILATNYIDQFDFAISRPGRFDRLFQIMPPNLQSKLARWDKVASKLAGLKLLLNGELSNKQLGAKLSALTFDEFEALSKRLVDAVDQQQALSIVDQEFKKCTLQQSPRDTKEAVSETWQKRSQKQARYIR